MITIIISWPNDDICIVIVVVVVVVVVVLILITILILILIRILILIIIIIIIIIIIQILILILIIIIIIVIGLRPAQLHRLDPLVEERLGLQADASYGDLNTNSPTIVSNNNLLFVNKYNYCQSGEIQYCFEHQGFFEIIGGEIVAKSPYTCLLLWIRLRFPCVRLTPTRPGATRNSATGYPTVSSRTENLDFRGLDPSRLLISRVGIPGSRGSFPEN